MLGFKVALNGEVVCVACADNVASVIASIKGTQSMCGEEPPLLNVNGITAPYTHTTWLKSTVKLGDRITIDVVDIAASATTAPIEVRKMKP